MIGMDKKSSRQITQTRLRSHRAPSPTSQATVGSLTPATSPPGPHYMTDSSRVVPASRQRSSRIISGSGGFPPFDLYALPTGRSRTSTNLPARPARRRDDSPSVSALQNPTTPEPPAPRPPWPPTAAPRYARQGPACLFLFRLVGVLVDIFFLWGWGWGILQRARDTESSLEKVKRQLSSGSGRYLLQGPLLKRSETV